MYLLAEFRDKEAVTSAIRSLRATGFTPDDIALYSEEPVELRRGVLDRPSHMSLASVLGAIAAGTLATAGVYWAQHNYKMVTGGMPIFSFWATGVITYETTMMGAVLATFAWFLWESGLIRKRDKSAPVPEVPPESICLRLRCERGQSEHAAETMQLMGAILVERRGE